MVIFNLSTFFNTFSSNNKNGSSTKTVLAPIDNGPNKAYECPFIHPAFEAVKITEFLFIPNCFRQEYFVAKNNHQMNEQFL